MKTVGIIGGLGPLAGAQFYRRLVELTPATRDEEHIPVILISNPTVPSRIAHLSGEGESPAPKLIEIGQQLVQIGAQVIALPSTTTSLYQAEVARAIDVPIVSLIDEVAQVIASHRCKKVGVMGTTPTRTFRAYEGAFENLGLEPAYPDDSSQLELMAVIHAVKGAKGQGTEPGQEDGRGTAAPLETLRREVAAIASRPWAQHLDAVLLGCTELPVLFPDANSMRLFPTHLRVFSSTEILASAVVRLACND